MAVVVAETTIIKASFYGKRKTSAMEEQIENDNGPYLGAFGIGLNRFLGKL